MSPKNEIAFSVGIASSVLALILIGCCEDYILFDSANKKIMHVYRFLFYRRASFFMDFSSIDSITVQAHYNYYRDFYRWSYRVLMVDNSGCVSALSNYECDAFEQMLELGKKVALLTKASFSKPEDEKMKAKKIKVAGKYSFILSPYSFFNILQEIVCEFVVIIPLLFIARAVLLFFDII